MELMREIDRVTVKGLGGGPSKVMAARARELLTNSLSHN